MVKITWKKETFERTESGKSYKTRPASSVISEIDRRTFDNLTGEKNLKFWNGFCGGTCRAERGYTSIGFVPVRIVRQSPDRSKKIVDTFVISWEG